MARICRLRRGEYKGGAGAAPRTGRVAGKREEGGRRTTGTLWFSTGGLLLHGGSNFVVTWKGNRRFPAGSICEDGGNVCECAFAEYEGRAEPTSAVLCGKRIQGLVKQVMAFRFQPLRPRAAVEVKRTVEEQDAEEMRVR